MKYKIIDLKWITERGNIALIERGDKNKEYAVVRDLDPEEPFDSDSQWSWTVEYYPKSIEGLQKAIECFRHKSEYDYIPRCRLEELATNFKDYIIDTYGDEPDTSEIMDDIIDTYELSDKEIEFFGLVKSNDTE